MHNCVYCGKRIKRRQLIFDHDLNVDTEELVVRPLHRGCVNAYMQSIGAIPLSGGFLPRQVRKAL